MSKYIGITMRQERCQTYNEIRDEIDITFYDFLAKCGYVPILIPNNCIILDSYLRSIDFCGFILSGGGLPYPYSNEMTERDYVEKRIMNFAKEHELTVLGICRGMQAIVINHGAELIKVDNHVATVHQIKTVNRMEFKKNSFHRYALKEKNENISILATANDNVIEAVHIKNTSLYGIMWHPERNEEFDIEDINLIRRIFKEEDC
ncbi:MAG: gamma-glutamyl-gamma-aminobutyrate hydrolase family protein [Pseudobutyrivibrio sp.]|uniref:gamma-glutamyl-gamma-aminobutyrate hydrolase family protein n=1 Tax=Pseudobutyrivibrio sp. TaxID=2014367 RepID=UPI0025DAAA7D|nr:gamma-glutamyl-gamma-aminobutyrate hydrolase family protein [Pseudobutyrivibrio sp.]MBQ6462346.1 gamma-glutamyl-gamma-aminobutyrate hydrolase family protein [Pseudobutyrivibrio sp.]